MKVSPQICFTKQVLHQRIIPPGEDMPPKSRMDVTRNFPPKKTWQHKLKMMLLQKRMKAILTKTMCKLTSNLLDVSDQNHAKRYLLLWLKSLLSNAVKWDLIRLSLKLSALDSCNRFYCWTLLTNRPGSFFAPFNKICGDKQFPCLVLSTLLCLEKKIAELDKKLAQSIFPPPLIRTWLKLGGALVWDLGKIEYILFHFQKVEVFINTITNWVSWEFLNDFSLSPKSPPLMW